MSEPSQQSTSSPPPLQPRRTIGSVTLPTFWPNNPAAWFRSVEAQFVVKGVTEAADRYYLVLASLGEAQVERVHNVLDEEPGDNAYQKIKDALLSTHTLTPFQMVDKIVNMEPLGSRKPTELLAAMSRFRPKEDHHFFAYHFLQRLPREIRVLLARDCCKDLQAVAEKADALMALHLPQSHDITAVAPVTDEAVPGSEEELAAAIQKGGKKKKKWIKKKRQQEEIKSPLCHFHIKFGDKAHRCEEPCAWPAEN
jgi:hypothetical protein